MRLQCPRVTLHCLLHGGHFPGELGAGLGLRLVGALEREFRDFLALFRGAVVAVAAGECEWTEDHGKADLFHLLGVVGRTRAGHEALEFVERLLGQVRLHAFLARELLDQLHLAPHALAQRFERELIPGDAAG